MEKAEYINRISGKETVYKRNSIYEKLILSMLKKMQKGRLNITLPSGKSLTIGHDAGLVSANIKIIHPDFFKKCVLFGDVGFGESYVEGDWETDSITNVISWMILNIENNPSISGSSSKLSPVNWLNTLNRIFHKKNINSRSGSKKNISAHYDLNNDFFRLWLDKSMTYSSGLFEKGDESLQEAQEAKYGRICRSLNITAEDHILEIGTGWGGFSIYAAKNYGCKITTTTISREQYDYASKKFIESGLEDKIEILLRDYRELRGTYHKIVSIEMLEAVGDKFLPVYFSKINELLKPEGAVALQVITSHDSNYDKLRKGVDWIQKHIFPGSLLPSVGKINETVNKTSNMHLHDLRNFGSDYAKTLKEWRNNFNNSINDVFELGFDKEFRRKWNYYLSYCEAAFAMRNISVVQMVYTRPNFRGIN